MSMVLILISCTDKNERELMNFDVQFRNSSSNALNIKGFDSDNNMIFQDEVLNSESSTQCQSVTEVFNGFGCSLDSLVFSFDNDKGYICSKRASDTSNLCFSSKTPFGDDPSFVSLGNSTFEFVITQEDFDNALDLPN